MSAALLADLHRRCFTVPPPWSEADFAGFLADPQCRLITRCDGDHLQAFALFRIVLDEAELLTLATDPEARRKGHARALLQEGLVVAHAAGARVCYLEVAADNLPAISFYRGMGFAQAGLRRGYYHAPGLPPKDALVFRAVLDGRG
ncbi:MAG: GNAT family N-acetyltransferase [Natronohydrobacter sp.]|nr:GNAT family N-acetyltransferase [Natronohydrobacter sp.]